MNMVHPLLEFRPSAIHGLGGFAVTAISTGSRVIEYTGEQITKEQSLELCARNNQAIFCLNKDWDLDGSVEWNPARFLNHSCSPNCDAERIDDRIWIIARRDIRSGEEILNLFAQLNREGVTVVLVTHDLDVAAATRRTIEMRDGHITGDHLNGTRAA